MNVYNKNKATNSRKEKQKRYTKCTYLCIGVVTWSFHIDTIFTIQPKLETKIAGKTKIYKIEIHFGMKCFFFLFSFCFYMLCDNYFYFLYYSHGHTNIQNLFLFRQQSNIVLYIVYTTIHNGDVQNKRRIRMYTHMTKWIGVHMKWTT